MSGGGRGAFEALESRRLLSVTVEDGAAVIRGTDGDDEIVFSLYTSWEQFLYKVKVNRVAQPRPTGSYDRFVIDGGRGDDRVRVITSTYRVDVYGRAGDDLVTLNAWGLVKAGGGDDVVNADSSYAVTLHGGAGDDLLIGGSGDFNHDRKFDGELYGGAGRDTLYGGVGRDLLDGGTGGDLLRGEAGNDVLIDGGGIDRLFGEAGGDTLHVSKHDLHDGDDEDHVLLA